MVLEAVPGSLAAIRVDGAAYRPIDAALVDGDPETLGRSLTALIEAEGGRPPTDLVLVVPGDLDGQRFATLTEAVGLAGLPGPSWLPDAVAWAGDELACWEAGTPVSVVDSRGDQLAVWPVRTSDDGVEIAEGGAVDLGDRVDALLTGLVHAELAVVAPGVADALRRRTDAASRRDAAHLGRELREGRRLMCTSDGEELVVSAAGAEVIVGRREFTDLVEHALREIAGRALGHDGSDVTTIVVADRETPVVEHLAEACGATVLWTSADAGSLGGAAALVLPRPEAGDESDEDDVGPPPPPFVDPAPTDRIPVLVDAMPASAPVPSGGALVLSPHRPLRSGRRPRWAVPALSTLLAVVLVGAATVLATAPGAAPDEQTAEAVSPTVPLGLVGGGPQR